MPSDFHKLQIAGIIQETHDTRSYILAVPESLRKEFRYRAGQFLTFEVPWEGMQLRRCYSLSSAPGIDPWPKVTVKRVDDGRVSNWFNDSVRVGDSILVQPPEGDCSVWRGQRRHSCALDLEVCAPHHRA
ncbi:MAG: hypothetical protein JRG70_12525 [Deltaproteobacteria bacterium]|nr:hypothetical protein [Deltaproteobacteria bacterium]